MHLRNSWILLPVFLCLAQWLQAQCPTSGNVTVTSNANSGTNTLRWAIDCINTVTPLTTIVFDIPAAGIQTINLNSSLPAVTKANALIDGTATETAVIDGSIISALSDGIVISAANVTVRGLRITNFNSTAPGGAAIRISGNNATVSDNFLYNNRVGIIVRDPAVSGPPVPVQNPLITGNTIGENATGAASGNSAQGILFENTPNSAIVRDNIIAHNGSNGVRANTTGGTLLISENSMFCNASAGIFRLSSPIAPTITEANTQRIRGTASGGNLVEIFEYHDTGCAATDPCQGRTLLGTTTANALGFWTFTLAAGAVTPGNQVTATRTAGGNNTYPFATCTTIADCSGFSVSITPTAITCNGENNGQLSASAPGGSSTSYVWNNGANTPVITGLGPGTYSVTATDAAGCTATATQTLSNPPLLTVGMSGTNITCFGAANGTATAAPAGGTPNYQYSWSNSGNTPTLSNLGPGTYFVTVADANLCRTIGNVTITQPAALNISCAEQNPTSTVGGSDGSATVQIAGGTAAYSIAWSGAASGSQNQAAAGTATITGLVSGNYSLTVTDANGCQQTCNFSIGAPNCNITLQISGTNPTCNGAANGSINLTVNGATGSLNFDWNVNPLDGQQNPTALSAGTYSVTVTDAANCTASTSISLTQPATLAIVCGQQNPVSVIGGSDGSATVQIAGGTAAYSIAWSGAASGSQNQAAAGTATITGLVSGNYSLTVTDANGCQQTCNFSIGAPNCNITLQISGTNPTCNGAANGSISLTVNGATGNLNFDWNVNSIDGLQNPTALSAGTYSVTVTDAANCTASTSISLTQPAALAIVCGQQNPVSVIGGSDGSATVQIAGGTAAYSIAWSGAASGSQNQAAAGTAVITGLRSGNYSLTVTDANGCQQTCNFSIGAPNCNITLQISGTNPTCNGAANGSISLTVNGATGNLNFDWNVNSIDGLQNPTGLSAGTYSVTVTDAANCTASTSISLTQPAALAIVCGQQNPVSVIGGSDGSATVQISGGTAAYAIAWSGAASGSQNQAATGTATITGLLSGNYSLTVTDANACQQTCNFSIGAPNCNITLQISGTNPTCNGANNGSISLTVNGATGSLNFDWNVNPLDGQQNPTALSAGTYSVTVTDAANCTASTSTTLTQPAALAIVCGQQNPVSVIGGSDGSATVQIAGGTAAYSIAWSGAASGSQNQAAAGTAVITGLRSGNYSLTVTDANGCQQTCNFSIGSPNCNITLQISGTNPTCNGAANGSINLTVNGATGSLNFNWNVNALDGQQNPTALSAGTYSVTVTDAGGCTASRSIVLTDPPALQLNVSATPETTAGANNGTATAAATGGTGSYTFAWSNGANTSAISGLPPGNYTATVTDGNLCTTIGTVNVAAGLGGGGSCVAQPVYAVAVPARVCRGDTIRLEADDLYPSPNVRYVWFVPNGDSVTTVQPRVGILAASSAYSGQYFALRDSLGCRSIRVGGAPVQVQSLPDDAATVAMMDTVLCAPGVVTLRALPALGGTGMWLPLNAATVDNPGNEQTAARNLQRGPNRFVWQVRLDGCTFSASDTVTVTVEAPPVLLDDRYTLQRVQDVLVMEVLLNDNLSGLPDTVLTLIGGGPAVGQLELLDGRRFRYTVNEDFRGKVSFQYVVCNPGAQCGTACDTATVTIEVLNMPVVPGGLIVDDPGPNGQLTIRGLNGFSRVEMQIFSRWGDLVFEEEQYDNGNPWQGHAHRSGNALPEGAYYYVLRAFDGNVQIGEVQRGVVHLFR